MASQKLRVLVFFGGRSPEHDVSIITGLQALKALDPERYEPSPIYVSPNGEWLMGNALCDRSAYIPSSETLKKLTPVVLDLAPKKRPALITRPRSVWRKSKIVEFDVALLAFHGLIGEDGGIQGLLNVANVPFTGMRTLASSILMDKTATKKMLAATTVPLLPFWEIKRPAQGFLLTPPELKDLLPNVVFPCCLKPANLGSSIGVAKVETLEDISDVLASKIFPYDRVALLEPFVENLVEYNVAVRKDGANTVTSAIERPKTSSELLDFKAKYMSGGGTKGNGPKTIGPKDSEQISQGMLSLTREINPALPPAAEKQIRHWAITVFEQVGGTGAPRLDFLCNGKTGELWFNEANPLPGSFGYFLWEASRENPVFFSGLLSQMIDEALFLHAQAQIPLDPTPEEARLFPRK